MPAIRVLSLHDNQLVSLPNTLADASTLERLDVNYNQLTTLPRSLTRLSKLRTLTVAGNPLTSPPQVFNRYYHRQPFNVNLSVFVFNVSGDCLRRLCCDYEMASW
jgi:leucine-rich repeat protein SHOC2